MGGKVLEYDAKYLWKLGFILGFDIRIKIIKDVLLLLRQGTMKLTMMAESLGMKEEELVEDINKALNSDYHSEDIEIVKDYFGKSYKEIFAEITGKISKRFLDEEVREALWQYIIELVTDNIRFGNLTLFEGALRLEMNEKELLSLLNTQCRYKTTSHV